MKRILLILALLLSHSAWASTDPVLQKAVDLTYNAHFDEAESILNQYISSHPDKPMGYVLRGTLLTWKQKLLGLKKKYNTQILDDYQNGNIIAFRLWEKDPENIEKMVDLGNTYMYLAKEWINQDKKARAGLILKKCKKHMDDAIAKNPQFYDAYLALGLFNYYAANIPSGFQFLASLLGISGNEPKGLQQIETSAANPNPLQADSLYMLTYIYSTSKKNYLGAQKYLDQLIAKYPDNFHFIYLRGELSFRAKNFDQARTDLNTYFDFCKTHTCSQGNDFLANYFYGGSFMEQNRLPEAKPYIEKAVSLNTNLYPDRMAGLHLYQGLLLKSEGKIEEAKAELQKVDQKVSPGSWKKAQEALQGL